MIKTLIERLLRPFIKNEEDKKRLSTVIIPSFIVRTGYFIISYLTVLVLTRTLGPSRYGIYSYTTTIIYMLMNFSSYGFEVLALKYTSSYLAKGEKRLWRGLYNWSSKWVLITGTTVAAGTALFLWIFVFILHSIPQSPYILPIIVTCSIIPVYTLMNLYTNILRGQHKLLIAFLPDNTIKPLFLFITLVICRLVLGEMNLHVAIGLNILSFIIAFAFVFIVFRKVNDLKEIKAEYDKSNWRNFVGTLFILTCVTSINTRIDILMLSSMKDSSQVGVYSAAERVANSLLFFLYVMNMIIAPSIARLNTLNDKEKLQKMITRTIRWVMLFSMPAFIGLLVFSGQIMRISGPQFVSGKSVLMIICCTQIIAIAFGPVSNFSLMTGHQKYNTIYTVIMILLNIVFNLILTPRWGYNGTAVSSFIAVVFWNAAMFITIKKKTGIRTWIFG